MVTGQLVGRGGGPDPPAPLPQPGHAVRARDRQQLGLGILIRGHSRGDLIRLHRGELTGAHRAVHAG
jgi:hypothetical protein